MKTDKEPERGTEAPRNSRAEGGTPRGGHLKATSAAPGREGHAQSSSMVLEMGMIPMPPLGWCPGDDRTGITPSLCMDFCMEGPHSLILGSPCRVWNSTDPTEIPILAASHLFRFSVPSPLLSLHSPFSPPRSPCSMPSSQRDPTELLELQPWARSFPCCPGTVWLGSAPSLSLESHHGGQDQLSQQLWHSLSPPDPKTPVNNFQISISLCFHPSGTCRQ